MDLQVGDLIVLGHTDGCYETTRIIDFPAFGDGKLVGVQTLKGKICAHTVGQAANTFPEWSSFHGGRANVYIEDILEDNVWI